MTGNPSSGRGEPPPIDRRVWPRSEARVPVGYSGARLEGRGMVCNLSGSGTRLFEITTPVPNGVRLNLEFGMLSGLPSFSLSAEVVRQTEDGFAVRFLEADVESRRRLGFLLKRITERAKSEPC